MQQAVNVRSISGALQRMSWPAFGCVLLAVVIVAAYGQTLWHPLSAWDDEFNIEQNRNLNPASRWGVANHWREPYGLLCVPVTYTFWAGEAWLAERPATDAAPRRLAPRVFHAGNLAFNALLVLAILRIVVAAE